MYNQRLINKTKRKEKGRPTFLLLRGLCLETIHLIRIVIHNVAYLATIKEEEEEEKKGYPRLLLPLVLFF